MKQKRLLSKQKDKEYILKFSPKISQEYAFLQLHRRITTIWKIHDGYFFVKTVNDF